jgi:hypothetical protein
MYLLCKIGIGDGTRLSLKSAISILFPPHKLELGIGVSLSLLSKV